MNFLYKYLIFPINTVAYNCIKGQINYNIVFVLIISADWSLFKLKLGEYGYWLDILIPTYAVNSDRFNIMNFILNTVGMI